MVPPAPPFVLKVQGPEVLAQRFGKSVDQVFPLRMEALVEFAHPPHRRVVLFTRFGRQSDVQAPQPVVVLARDD